MSIPQLSQHVAQTITHGNVQHDLDAGGRGLITDCHVGSV
jgi:hypothetical protein